MKNALLVLIAISTLGILSYLGYDTWRQHRMDTYDECFRIWNFNPQGKTLIQACGTEP